MKNHIIELDGLRGIAVILVMTLHIFEKAVTFTTHPLLQKFTKLTTFGWFGVDIFFALSGFLITSILLKTKTDAHYFRNFYARRILRIFPLYYLAIIFVVFFAPYIEPEVQAQFGKTIPFMLIYQQNWGLFLDNFILSEYLLVTWSLAVEEQFYFILPMAVYYLKSETLKKLIAGYIVVSILARLVGIIFWQDFNSVSYFFYFSSFARFEEMLFGSLLAILMTNESSQKKITKFSLPVFGFSFLAFIIICSFALPNGTPDPEISTVPLVITSYTVIALFSTSLIAVFITHSPQNVLRRIFRNPVLTFLGKYSYSMYLFHMVVVIILFHLFLRIGFTGWGAFMLYAVLVYIFTVLIALMTWHLIEKPFLNLKKHFEYKTS